MLTLDHYLVQDLNGTFLARVKDDSMRAALVDGHLLVIQKNCPTKIGDIVVAVSMARSR